MKSLSKYTAGNSVNISIDAEWCGKSFLSVQLAVSDNEGNILQYYMFMKEPPEEGLSITEYRGVPVEVIEYPIGLKGILDYFEEVPLEINCFFFYSPRDIESFLGAEEWTKLLVGAKVEKKRNLLIKPYSLEERGFFCGGKRYWPKVYFSDLIGRFGSSLESAYSLVGMDTSQGKDYIHTLNIDKSRMDLFLRDHPTEFMEYSLGDLSLHLLALKLLKLMNEVLWECFGIKDMYKDLDDYPGTVGSMVSDVFIRFINDNYPGVLKACGYLTTSNSDKGAKSLGKLLDRLDKDEPALQLIKSIQNSKYLIHGLGACSIPAFFPGNYGSNDTSPYGAVVQGGRAIKEDESRNKFTDVLDIDLSSAYGSSLKRFDYPIGLPTVVSVSNHDPKPLTLRKFLRRYGDELVDKLYVIYVSGFLNHKQDLVFSKYGLSSSSIGSRLLVGEYEDEDSFNGRVGGEFLLTTSQLELGIITSEVLDVLKKVASSLEYSSWLDLHVKLAVFYPKSKEMSIETWVSQHSSISNIGNKSSSSDERSRNWCRFPLESFIGKIISMRKIYKQKKDESPLYNSKQTLLKLITNTLYGDLASPYFPIGNTVIANNITASVRVGSWLMSKALGCKFIVTDGGIYEWSSVPRFKTELKSFKKPGLQNLMLKDGKWKDIVEYVPLDAVSNSSQSPINIKELILISKDIAAKQLDEMALEVISRFCEIYGINFPFEIEHKISNSSALAVTNPYGKVDYLLHTYWGIEVIKIRGVKQSDYSCHPKVELLRAIAEDREARFHGCLLSHIVGVNEYVKSPSKFNEDLPGHDVVIECFNKPFKDSSTKFSNYLDYSRALDAYRKRVTRYDNKYGSLDITLRPAFKI